MFFLPALDWLIAGGMIAALFFVVIIALLVNPPTALINKMHEPEHQPENDKEKN